MSTSMSTPSTKKRKRSRRACIPCHQRKRKCDGGYPCAMCTDFEYTCRYSTDHASPSLPTRQGEASSAQGPSGSDGISNGVSNGRSSLAAAASSPSLSPSRSPTSARQASRSRGNATQATAGSRRNGSAAAASATTPAKTTNAVPTTTPDAGESCDPNGLPGPAGSSAAMAFPHALGLALGSDSPPKVRSFAYNFGIRPEEASQVHGSLSQFISEKELREYSQVYFAALAPIGDLVDARIYAQRCREYYRDQAGSVAFGAVAAGIAALGSFLSSTRHPREADLVQYAKAILEDPASIRSLSIDLIVAYGFRIFYLRATTRPSTAWLASCTALHLCEALGLHEEEKIHKHATAAGAAALGHDEDRLRRIFWISWAGHTLLSYEYDRSSVHFRHLTTRAIIPIGGSIAHQFVQIAQMILTPNSPFQLDQQLNHHDALFERLKTLEALPFTDPFLVLTKADLAFCFYRRIYQLKTGVSEETIRLVIQCGNAALDAADQLASQGRLFWNVIGSVFQYVCTLLAIDTPTATVRVSAALTGLENLVKAADTPLTREAWSIAQHLLSLSLARKRKELADLEPFETTAPPTSQAQAQAQAQTEVDTTSTLPDLSWDWDWDQFLLEPYLNMFDQVD